MNVQLTPQSEEILRSKAASGLDPSAVIEEALLLLDEQERLATLRAALAIGQAQLDRGEYVFATAELREEIKREVVEMRRQGKQPSPDVCP